MSTTREKEFVFETVERNRDAIALLCDNIFYFAELSMQEFETSGLMMEPPVVLLRPQLSGERH